MTLFSRTFTVLLTSLIPAVILCFKGVVDIKIGSMMIVPLFSLSLYLVRSFSIYILKKDKVLFSSYRKSLSIIGIIIVAAWFTIIALFQIQESKGLYILFEIELVLTIIWYSLLLSELVITKNMLLIKGELLHRSEVNIKVQDNVLNVQKGSRVLKQRIKSNIEEIKKSIIIEEVKT